LGILGVLLVLGVLAAIFDLGPFRSDEVPTGLGSGGGAIAQGDEICGAAHEAFADLQRHPPATASDAAELTGRLIDIASDEADQLESLSGSPGFEAQIDRYVAARRRGIEAMRDGQAAAEDRDARAYEQAQAAVADSQRARHRIARRIGFAVCSKPLSLAG